MSYSPLPFLPSAPPLAQPSAHTTPTPFVPFPSSIYHPLWLLVPRHLIRSRILSWVPCDFSMTRKHVILYIITCWIRHSLSIFTSDFFLSYFVLFPLKFSFLFCFSSCPILLYIFFLVLIVFMFLFWAYFVMYIVSCYSCYYFWPRPIHLLIFLFLIFSHSFIYFLCLLRIFCLSFI